MHNRPPSFQNMPAVPGSVVGRIAANPGTSATVTTPEGSCPEGTYAGASRNPSRSTGMPAPLTAAAKIAGPLSWLMSSPKKARC